MSDNSLSALYVADKTMHQNVREAHHEVESQRLLRKAKAESGRNYRFYCAALAWLGHRLAAWGHYLQERYSPEDSAPVAQSA
jgi:hypothetical protein